MTKYLLSIILAVLFTAVIAWSLIACRLSIPLPIGRVEPGGVLFKDDFSIPYEGWQKIMNFDGEAGPVNGAYRILVNSEHTDLRVTPGLYFGDVQVEVDISKVNGSENNHYGVICRSQDRDNFYEMLISSDGYYGIVKVKGGVQIPLGAEALRPSEAIRRGEATNHVLAECIGDILVLWVNEEILIEVSDGDFTSGDVGLIAGSYDPIGTEILFDNFSVINP